MSYSTSKPATVIKKIFTRAENILPFKEKPANNYDQADQNNLQASATDLFSLFTADIIKANTLFIR